MRQNSLEEDLNLVLEHTVDLWEELRGQRIFITGGTGFFGCWLLESFAWACDKLVLGAEAVVLTRRPESFAVKAPHLASHPSIRLVTGDVRSFSFPEGGFSHMIHAASLDARLNNRDPSLVLDTILNGTGRTLDFARRCGARKFLFTSSGAVYGKQAPDLARISEDCVPGAVAGETLPVYGRAKLQAEGMCALEAEKHGIDVKIARGFSFVGPYLPLDIHYAIGNFIRDGINGGPVRILGDGSARRSYLYAADLAVWLWTILFRGKTCRPYNVGSEEEISIEALAKEVTGVFEAPLGIEIEGGPVQTGSGERYVPSTERARMELGLNALTALSEALRRTAGWHFAGVQR
ncbi:MAG: NAD-dependent epimerase/dehydratase family protein [Deltaproteobacteria bacterium]|nr:NAD-dependent epimerase/dehydratase family protein [Deltaproteobacteria bacterium]